MFTITRKMWIQLSCTYIIYYISISNHTKIQMYLDLPKP